VDWITCSLRNEILGVVTIVAANLTIQLFMVIILVLCVKQLLVIIILAGVLAIPIFGV
jgi:hypothetical protein